MAANGQVVPDGIVMANGDTREVAGVRIEAIAAYDVTPVSRSTRRARPTATC